MTSLFVRKCDKLLPCFALWLLIGGLSPFTVDAALLLGCSTAQEKKTEIQFFGFSLGMPWSEALLNARAIGPLIQRTPGVAHGTGAWMGVPASWSWRENERSGELMALEVLFRPLKKDEGIERFSITKQLVEENHPPVRTSESIWWWAEGEAEINLRRIETFSKDSSSPTVVYSFFATRAGSVH